MTTAENSPQVYHVAITIGGAPVIIPIRRSGTSCEGLVDEVSDMLYDLDDIRYQIRVTHGVDSDVFTVSRKWSELQTYLENGNG